MVAGLSQPEMPRKRSLGPWTLSLSHMTSGKRVPVLRRSASPESPLFKLPPELSNRIYEFVFEITGEDTIYVTDAFLPPGYSRPNANTALPKLAPPSAALIRCCQTLYEESQGIFLQASRSYWKKDFVLKLEQIRHIPVFKCLIDSIPTRKMYKLFVLADVEHEQTLRFALCRCERGIWSFQRIGIDGSTRSTTRSASCALAERQLRLVLYHYFTVTPRRLDIMHCRYGYSLARRGNVGILVDSD